MNRFWTDLIEPLAQELRPRTIVEIGSDEGAGTEKLLAFCRRTGAHLHVVDPKPAYDAQILIERWSGVLTYHLATSLDALPSIGAVDLALIDGDHNWYTVRHELELLHAAAAAAGVSFPLTFLHDVGWPYGRRDLYYNPETVPAPQRQPYANGGLRPGRSALIAGGGYNAHCFNAVEENTPRNGVLTAVDDFVAAHPEEGFALDILPVLFGVAILYRHSDPRPAGLQDALARTTLTPMAKALVALAERERIEALIDQQALARRVDLLERRLDASQGALMSHQSGMGRLSERLEQARIEAARSRAVAVEKEAEAQIRIAEIDEARSRVADLERRWATWEASFAGRIVRRLRLLSAHHPRTARLVHRTAYAVLIARARIWRLFRPPPAQG